MGNIAREDCKGSNLKGSNLATVLPGRRPGGGGMAGQGAWGVQQAIRTDG